MESAIDSSNVLAYGTQVILRVCETFVFNVYSYVPKRNIHAIVQFDVYSADGSTVLIKAGTPASIEFFVESNGSWGKAGKIYLTYATMQTVNNRRVSLRLGNCMEGGSNVVLVIILSVVFFPLGLISGCIKGSMPAIHQGSVFSAYVL